MQTVERRFDAWKKEGCPRPWYNPVLFRTRFRPFNAVALFLVVGGTLYYLYAAFKPFLEAGPPPGYSIEAVRPSLDSGGSQLVSLGSFSPVTLTPTPAGTLTLAATPTPTLAGTPTPAATPTPMVTPTPTAIPTPVYCLCSTAIICVIYQNSQIFCHSSAQSAICRDAILEYGRGAVYPSCDSVLERASLDG